MNEKQLIMLRPKGKNWVAEMTPEEIRERRAAIREILRYSSFSNMTDDEIDLCRLLPTDSGHVLEVGTGHAYFIKSRERVAADVKFRKERAMIPFEFQGVAGKDFNWTLYGEENREKTDKIKKIINGYIMNFEELREKGVGLFISSRAKGSGKTMLSCCILNELAGKYAVSVKFINALDLLELTKQSYKGPEPEEIYDIYAAGILVIDDLGVQLSKDWVNTVFYRLINDRHVNKRPVIYTSNMAADMLKMDGRIIDRIQAGTIPLQLPEVSVRSNNRQKEIQELVNKLIGPLS